MISRYIALLMICLVGYHCEEISVPSTGDILGGVNNPSFPTTSPIGVTWFNYCNSTLIPKYTCPLGSPSNCFDVPYPVSLRMHYDNSSIIQSGAYSAARLSRVNIMIAGQVQGNTGHNPTTNLALTTFQTELHQLSTVSDISTLSGRAEGTIFGLNNLNLITGWKILYITPDYHYKLDVDSHIWTVYDLSTLPNTMIAAGFFFDCVYDPSTCLASSACVTL
jgi:hypothetical protein